MESNHNGSVDRNAVEAIPGDKSYPTEWNQQDNYGSNFQVSLVERWNQITTEAYSGSTQPNHQQQFYPQYDQSSSFPYSNQQTYQASPHYGQTQFQPPYHNQNPPYYQQNYQQAQHNFPQNPNATYNHNSTIPQYQAQYQTQTFPTQPTPLPYPQPPPIPPQPHYGTDYRIETAPYQQESPMQRMKELARAKHGGKIAAQNAAVAAAVAPRRSPTLRPAKREGGEETVRDVLHRQYLEQKRLEQIQQMNQQSFESGFPNAYPSPIPSSVLSTPTHSSVFAASPPLARPDSPSTPATPIFSFPVVTARTPTSVSSPVSVLSTPTVASHGQSVRPHEPLTRRESDAGENKFDKTKSLMCALQKANTNAMKTNGSVEEMTFAGLHQAATVVQSLESKEKQTPSPLPVSRKRTLDRASPPLRQGVRHEMNENGEKVEKVYILLHHCNINDPEYNPNGVIKSLEEIQREKLREDMFCLTYSSAVCPYEICDFRIKKPIMPPPATTASSSSTPSNSSQ